MKAGSFFTGIAAGMAAGAAVSMMAMGAVMMNPHGRHSAVRVAKKAERKVSQATDALGNMLS